MKSLLPILSFLMLSMMAWGQTKVNSILSTQEASSRITGHRQGIPPHRTCATMLVDSAMRAANPSIGTLQQFEQWLQMEIAKEQQTQHLYTVPVVVHIIHDGESTGIGRNISAAQVQSQIEVLNEDFRRLNGDTVNTPLMYQPVAADVEVEFCLAKIDEQGNTLSEPGIHRVDRNIAGFQAPPYTTSYINNVIKPATQWDPTKYCNVWVLDIGGGILGYAQFPVQSGLPGMPTTGSANTDGIVVGYRYFGRGNFQQLAPPYHLGRTATHEMGHWLGLRHIWGDGNCSADDFCNDTPLADGPRYQCQTGSQSCSSDDMVENYMDYSDDGCMNLFTLDQRVRMRTVLQNSPRRKELQQSIVCNPNVAPVAEFTASPRVIYAGGEVRFEDLSAGNPTQWNWQFGGGFPNTDTTQNPVVRYSTPGTYSVVLQVTNANGTDTEFKTGYIQVLQAAGCDTLNNPPPGQLTIYTVNGEPLVGWSNQAQDLSKAQYFNNYQPFSYINGGIYYFPIAHKAQGSNASVTFSVWDNTGAGGEPGNIIDSVTVDLAIIEFFADNNFSLQINFDPIAIPGNFYMGFTMNNFTNQDTLAMASNTTGNSPGGLAWEQWSDGSWHPFDSIYSVNGSPLEISMYAAPIVSQTLPFATFNSSDTAVCVGETITFVADSQLAGNSYSWVFPGANPFRAFGDSVTVSYDTAGTHDVYLLVDGGCNSSDDTIATNLITVNSIPSIDSFHTLPAGCGLANGEATAVVSGGVAPYQYQWDAAANYQNTITADSLAAGTYYLFIEDSKGCSDVGIADVGTANAPKGSIVSTQMPSCFGGADGQATVSATQGTPPYTYQWPGGASGPQQSGLSSGSYIVTITDDRGCSDQLTVVINQPAALMVNTTVQHASCTGNDGTITAQVSGGTPGYTYQWSDNQSSNVASALTPGVYTVTVTDSKGCTVTTSDTVTQAPPVTIDSLSVQAATCLNNDGSAGVFASGGTGSYTYQWSNGDQGQTINGIPSGQYRVTVTDGGGCTAIDTATVPLQDNLTGTVSADQTICRGETAVLTAGGGLQFTWIPAPSNIPPNPDTIEVMPNTTTTYTIIVATGTCADTLTTTVVVNALPDVSIDQGDSLVVCKNTMVTLNSSGAVNYVWSTGETGSTINFTAGVSQSIIVTGTDNNGCSQSDTIFVEVDDCTGIGSPQWTTSWEIYPNPAQDQVMVSWPEALNGPVTVRIFTTTGALMYASTGRDSYCSIDIQQWATGLYQVELSYQGRSSYRQLSIVR